MRAKDLVFIMFRPLKVFGTLHERLLRVRKLIYTASLAPHFKAFGHNSVLNPRLNRLDGADCIEVGDLCYIGKNVSLLANSSYRGVKYEPQIIISDRCSIGDESNLTCINKIYLGKGVLTGRKVLIADHGHGDTSMLCSGIPVRERPLISPGPVIIEDDVWIGEKASIMPGVTIGKGSVIGANSVVTKDIPPYSVAVGMPAKVIKTIDPDNRAEDGEV